MDNSNREFVTVLLNDILVYIESCMAPPIDIFIQNEVIVVRDNLHTAELYYSTVFLY